jgi:broad specificity phosphatase PhoE
VIEADNLLEGQQVSVRNALRTPKVWWHLRNPFRPSWGEAYTEVVARMRLAMRDAAEQAVGHEAIIVSHQLPIWMARRDAEGRRLVHDPRQRQCALASVTSFTYLDGRIASIRYREPAADLLVTQVSDDVPGA